MHLTGLDLFFWAAGLPVNLGLLFVLLYRRRARNFPFFTAFPALSVVRTIVLYLVFTYASKQSYFYTYWSLATVDMLLQFCIVYELASQVFRPLGEWARQMRGSFFFLVSLSLAVAMGLSWLASPPARTWRQAFVTKGNLFAEALMSELFVAMMALAVKARIPWRTHVAKIAQGLGAYSLIVMLIESGHTYFGVGGEMPLFIVLSRVRMAAYLFCVSYWIINLWRNEQPSRVMTGAMREELFAWQTWVDYYLKDMRSRNK
jgi:hypothetical protein